MVVPDIVVYVALSNEGAHFRQSTTIYRLTLALGRRRGAQRRGYRQRATPAGGGRLERLWGIARPLEVCPVGLPLKLSCSVANQPADRQP